MKFSRATSLGTLVLAVCCLLAGAHEGQAQFFDQKDVLDTQEIDYEQVFAQGLSANGKTLNLSGKKIGDAGLELLLGKAFLQKVTKLDLRYNNLSEKGAKLLAESKAFGKLKKLDLRHKYFLDNGAEVLAQSKHMPKLEKLNLSFNDIRDQGALAFAETSNFPKLKKLDLGGNFLANSTKRTLKEKLSRLRTLKLF